MTGLVFCRPSLVFAPQAQDALERLSSKSCKNPPGKGAGLEPVCWCHGAGVGQWQQSHPHRNGLPRLNSPGSGVLGSLTGGFESYLAALNWDLKQN